MSDTLQSPVHTIPAPSEVCEKPRRRSVSWAAVVTFGLLLIFLGILGISLIKSRRGPVNKGPAPDFTLTGFDGMMVTLSQLRGQVVIINFWASWCLTCREEAAYLEQTWRKYKDQGVMFIGVDYVDSEKAALAYLKEYDITYLNGPDIGIRISDAYNIKGVPETFYISKNGEVRGAHIGPLGPPELDNKIEELLGEP
jgi:cytochrome c biogenesis protein CcmG/thiol:disulfide interchange protein DsbE